MEISNLIITNKNKVDREPLPKNHEKRFKKRLQLQTRKKFGQQCLTLACACFAASISLCIGIILAFSHSKNKINLSRIYKRISQQTIYTHPLLMLNFKEIIKLKKLIISQEIPNTQ